MQSELIHSVVKHLTNGQPPRVWSLLVTVFGELAQDRDSRISGLLLRHMSGQFGIKPEAMRVALHRLRKDGWIDSERSGRTSTYFLTAWGRSQSVQASPRIYEAHPAADRAWLVMTNPSRPVKFDDFTGAWISSNMLITSALPDAEELFVTSLNADTDLPGWMTNKVCDDATARKSRAFATALGATKQRLGAAPRLSILEVAAIRVLLVHSWRRIILKVPALPDFVFPETWHGAACRERVSDFLIHHPKPSLAELEHALTTSADI